MSKRTYLSSGLLSVLLMGASVLVGCGGTQVTEVPENLNGTCVNCHSGLTNAHPNGAAISCTGCHGGDATDAPFRRAGQAVFDLLATPDPDVQALNESLSPGVVGRVVPINPTKLADANEAPFDNGPQDLNNNQIGRYDKAFQVLLTSAHSLPKGCSGPKEIEAQPILDIDPVNGGALDPDGTADLDGDGAAEDRVQIGKLAPLQRQNIVNTQQAAGTFVANANVDCHAAFYPPNGMNDDGDEDAQGEALVDEMGEFASVNPNDPVGLVYEMEKLDTNNNGILEAADNVGSISLAESKTLLIDVDTANLGPVQAPVIIGNFYDSEINIDVNYVRWMNPGDVRTAQASCGFKSRASQFAGNCHDTEVSVVRRSIMSYMSGVLAGAIYANGAIPNSRSLTNADGQTDREVQDLRDGRIGYLQNYDTLDQTFDPEQNRFVLDADQAETATLGLRQVYSLSQQNQVRLNQIFGVNFTPDVAGDDVAAGVNTNGLEQDDCRDVGLGNVNTFTGNLCFDSFPEELFRIDDVVSNFLESQGINPQFAITNGGKFTSGTGKDVPANKRPGNRLIWDQVPLQDPQRSLFVLAPIPRRTLTGADIAAGTGNIVLFNNANAVSGATSNLGIVAALQLAAAPQFQVVGGILDDRQFARLGGINPVDTALQTFRPFHSLSYPNIMGDFNFFDERNLIDNNANNDVFVTRNNAHGRGRATGCGSCHMLYDTDGVNREPSDPTVRFNGKQPGDIFLGKSLLVNSGMGARTIFDANSTDFDPRDANADDEVAAQQGVATLLTPADELADNAVIVQKIRDSLGLGNEALPRMQYPTGMDDFGRERFYPSVHKLTTQINSKQCEYCHAFVTRAGFAAVGRHENEGGFEFVNWYTWTPRDVNNDGKIKHQIDLTAANAIADNNSELGRFMNNRGAAAEQDVLEFFNAVDPEQTVRIFNNLPAFDGTGGGAIMRNLGDRFTEDLNGNGLLDAGENRGDLLAGAALDLPDRPGRSAIIDGRQQRAVYGGASGGVLLQEIHLERGMHCIDCHFLQDNHGDGNLYARNWDAIEIECVDCHGTGTRTATLITSGPNGGHDLTKSKDQFGVPLFEVGNKGERIQRSRVIPGREWRIPQVVEAIDPKSKDTFNEEAAEAMAVLDAAGANAHIPELVDQVNEGVSVKRAGVGKLACFSCHNSWTPNCFTCHMDFDHGQTSSEIWATQQRNPISFFQLFTIIRSPFILAVAGSNDHNEIETQRSLMELHPNVTESSGDALVENFTFTSSRGMSGVAMNQYFPHTTRLKETKDCDSCHSLSPDNFQQISDLIAADESPFDNILNGNILAQTLGMGSGRFGEPGDYFFAGSAAGLESIDMKAEVKRALDQDGDGFFANGRAFAGVFQANIATRNTFQGFRGQGFGAGFLVANIDDTAQTNADTFNFDAGNNTPGNTGRSTAEAIAGGLADVVFIRNFVDPTENDPNSGQAIGFVRAMDIVVGALANSLTIRVVTDRTGGLDGIEAALPNTLTGNITAIDHIAPDMSSQFIYAVTDQGQLALVDLRKLINPNLLAGALFQDFNRAGFNGNFLASQRTDNGSNFRDIEVDGNFAFVLDAKAGNGASLNIFFARQLRRLDRVVNGGQQNSQVAGDFLLETPGKLNGEDLPQTGTVDLDFGGATCTDPRRIAIMNIFAYVACGADGLFVLNIEDVTNPRVIAQTNDAAVLDFANPGTPAANGTLDDAQGVFAMDNRLYVANGNAGGNPGVMVFDVTSPKAPIAVHTYTKQGQFAILDPVDIIGFIEPGEHWIFVSDSGAGQGGRAHAINVTEGYNLRVRLGVHAADAKLADGTGTEKAISVPGFRPEKNLVPFASQANLPAAGVAANTSAGLLNERPFFEFTNVKFSLDLRDPMTPNDPANIDDLIDGTPLIVTYLLAGGGDIRLAQLHDLDRLNDYSGFEERDSWAAAVKVDTNCVTGDDGDIGGINEQDETDPGCASDLIPENANGGLGARALSGPSFKIVGNDLVLQRGEIDLMRSVFVREENGVDLDGNGLGNLVCTAVLQRADGFSVSGATNCEDRYPKAVAKVLFKK